MRNYGTIHLQFGQISFSRLDLFKTRFFFLPLPRSPLPSLIVHSARRYCSRPNLSHFHLGTTYKKFLMSLGEIQARDLSVHMNPYIEEVRSWALKSVLWIPRVVKYVI